jgi:hypothetical protein
MQIVNFLSSPVTSALWEQSPLLSTYSHVTVLEPRDEKLPTESIGQRSVYISIFWSFNSSFETNLCTLFCHRREMVYSSRIGESLAGRFRDFLTEDLGKLTHRVQTIIFTSRYKLLERNQYCCHRFLNGTLIYGI